MASEKEALQSLRTHELFIDGKFVEAAGTWNVENPATGDVLAPAGAASVEQVDAAVRAAAEAFKTWRNVSDADRAAWLREWDFRPLTRGASVTVHRYQVSRSRRSHCEATHARPQRRIGSARPRARWYASGTYLPPATICPPAGKLADEVSARKSRIAAIEALNVGKPFREAEADMDDVVAALRYCAGLAEKGKGVDHIQPDQDALPDPAFKGSYIIYEPVGVVGAILPFNFPQVMMGWKVASALGAGCTLVVKPSEFTPYSALELAAAAQVRADVRERAGRDTALLEAGFGGSGGGEADTCTARQANPGDS